MNKISETSRARPGYRHEDKYLCDAMQTAVLKMRSCGLLKRDSHAKGGSYVVRSLYFDSPEDDCYYENESGVGERDKYRLRIYNADAGRIVLEKKSKTRGMTRKLSCPVSEELCRKLMDGGGVGFSDRESGLTGRMLWEMQEKAMRPAVIVEYLRFPFVEPLGNVRVTFDENIASSNEISRFLDKELMVRPVLEKGMGILEVKWDAFLPGHIKRHLQLESLQWSSFSKYYLCRKYNMYGGIRV